MSADAGDWLDSGREIACLFPLDMSGDVIVLRVGIDAGKPDSGILSVAGVAFGYDRAVKANAKWARLMKGRTFHMTDLHARQGDFKDISDSEVSEIMHGVVGIIRKYSSYFVAVSCDADLVAGQLPEDANPDADSREMRNAFRSPYGVMCHLCMYAFGQFSRRNGVSKNSISYVLEAGDDGQKGLLRFMRFIEDSSNAKALMDGYSYARLTITPKGELEGLFHAADFIAWEWSRHVDRHRSNAKMRKSLAVLTGESHLIEDKFGLTLGDPDNYFFRHYNEQNMERVARLARGLIEAKTNTELNQTINQWHESRP